ncbi:hypothetical protein [Streptomyces griseus]|uniref:hypothetical protein n=1 Tax=Streptomyces griseus TaxID=1911 RepID=UPI0037B0EBA4
MARRSRPSKERRARHRAAAERTARRDSLLVLLSRIQRGIPITPVEGALLRAHVEVELTDADQARAALGQQEAQHRQQLAAAHAAIREAEQDAADVRDRMRDLARRMRAGSPMGAAVVYADRIEQTLDTTPEPQP